MNLNDIRRHDVYAGMALGLDLASEGGALHWGVH